MVLIIWLAALFYIWYRYDTGAALTFIVATFAVCYFAGATAHLGH